MGKSDLSLPQNFRREASYERSHLFVPGDNVVVAFRILGTVSEEQFRNAIQKAQQNHPMINAHIEFDESRKAWFVAKDIPPCTIKVIPRTDDSTWIKSVIAEYWQPFKTTQEPLIRYLLIPGEKETELVVFAQHAICDGLSLTYLLRDIMTVVGNPIVELPQMRHVPTIVELYDVESIRIHPLIKKIFQKMNTLWTEHHFSFTPEDFYPLFDAFQNHRINAVTWNLNADLTIKLISRCQQEGISVNSALYCAILNVQHALQGDKEPFRKRIMMPVNLRKYLRPPVGEVVGLYAGGERFEISLKWSQEFWKQAKKVHRMLLKGITPKNVFSQAKRMMLLEPSVMDARIMLFLAKLFPTPPSKYLDLLEIIRKDRFLAKMLEKNTATQIQYGAVLTNIGIVSIPEQYGPYRLERVLFLPPSSPVAEKLIGVVTFNNHLQGTIAFTEKTLDVNVAEKFSRMIEEFIENQVV